jgi:hypothetical protein
VTIATYTPTAGTVDLASTPLTLIIGRVV